MEEKVKKTPNALREAMLFNVNVDSELGNVFIEASPAALKIIADELIKASQKTLGTEIEVDLDKYFGETRHGSSLYITVTETKDQSQPVKVSLLVPIGLGIAALTMFLIFLLGVERIYQWIF